MLNMDKGRLWRDSKWIGLDPWNSSSCRQQTVDSVFFGGGGVQNKIKVRVIYYSHI